MKVKMWYVITYFEYCKIKRVSNDSNEVKLKKIKTFKYLCYIYVDKQTGKDGRLKFNGSSHSGRKFKQSDRYFLISSLSMGF